MFYLLSVCDKGETKIKIFLKLKLETKTSSTPEKALNKIFVIYIICEKA